MVKKQVVGVLLDILAFVVDIILFDPCDLIVEQIKYNMDELSISSQSNISNISKLYFQDVDVTNDLSLINIDNKYQDVLYSLVDELIEINKELPI